MSRGGTPDCHESRYRCRGEKKEIEGHRARAMQCVALVVVTRDAVSRGRLAHSVDPIDAPAMIGRDYPPNRRFFSTESSPPLGG